MVVFIESSEILSALKILQNYSDEFGFYEASKAYLSIIKFIKSMENEKEDYSKYKKELYEDFSLEMSG